MRHARTHKFQLSGSNVHSLHCNRSETFCLTTEVWLLKFRRCNGEAKRNTAKMKAREASARFLTKYGVKPGGDTNYI